MEKNKENNPDSGLFDRKMSRRDLFKKFFSAGVGGVALVLLPENSQAEGTLNSPTPSEQSESPEENPTPLSAEEISDIRNNPEIFFESVNNLFEITVDGFHAGLAFVVKRRDGFRMVVTAKHVIENEYESILNKFKKDLAGLRGDKNKNKLPRIYLNPRKLSREPDSRDGLSREEKVEDSERRREQAIQILEEESARLKQQSPEMGLFEALKTKNAILEKYRERVWSSSRDVMFDRENGEEFALGHFHKFEEIDLAAAPLGAFPETLEESTDLFDPKKAADFDSWDIEEGTLSKETPLLMTNFQDGNVIKPMPARVTSTKENDAGEVDVLAYADTGDSGGFLWRPYWNKEGKIVLKLAGVVVRTIRPEQGTGLIVKMLTGRRILQEYKKPKNCQAIEDIARTAKKPWK